MNTKNLPLIKFEIQVRKSAVISGIWKSCLNCENWSENKLAVKLGEFVNEENPVCVLANRRPPTEVIVVGCPSWEDCIPF